MRRENIFEKKEIKIKLAKNKLINNTDKMTKAIKDEEDITLIALAITIYAIRGIFLPIDIDKNINLKVYSSI